MCPPSGNQTCVRLSLASEREGLAAIAPRGPTDRIYRVTTKPVAGDVSAELSALKILVSYNVLVIVRPTAMAGTVTGVRRDGKLLLTNTGTTSAEVHGGAQWE